MVVEHAGRRYRVPVVNRFERQMLAAIAAGATTSEHLRLTLETEARGARSIGYAVLHTRLKRLESERLLTLERSPQREQRGELRKLCDFRLTKAGELALEYSV